MSDKNDEKDTLGTTLIKSIYDPHLSEIIQDYGEIAIDALIQNDLLKEIPIIGTAVGFTKMGIAIRDRNFLKKILLFIQEFETITAKEKESLLNKINEDEKFQERVGETLILLLDRFDHFAKPKMLAQLFNGYLGGEIDYDKFQRLSTSVDRAFMPDLERLLSYYSKNTTPYQRGLTEKGYIWENLFPSGLSKIDPNISVDHEYGVVALSKRYGKPEDLINYAPNSYAETFARIILGDKYYMSFLTNTKGQ